MPQSVGAITPALWHPIDTPAPPFVPDTPLEVVSPVVVRVGGVEALPSVLLGFRGVEVVPPAPARVVGVEALSGALLTVDGAKPTFVEVLSLSWLGVDSLADVVCARIPEAATRGRAGWAFRREGGFLTVEVGCSQAKA